MRGGMASIGVNAQLLSSEHGYRGAGISSYLWHLLHGLAHSGQDYRLRIFHGSDLAAEVRASLPALSWHAAPWPMRRKPTRVAWEALALPRAARGLDLLHAPVNVLPARLPCPGVVTVHDLAFLHLPQVVAPLRRRYLAAAIRGSVRRAAGIIAVSAATRDDLIAAWGVAPERVTVVYPAIDPTLCPITDVARLAAFRQRVHATRPYILVLGTLEPRKNLATLIDAFALARDQGLHGHDLLLVGGTDWDGGRYAEGLRSQIHRRGLGDGVRLVGYVPAEDRALWYAAAAALAVPSWYEGFGFAAAEALACGTPVIASAAGSLPEVVGDAGVLCDPADVAAWADALRRAADDDAWRARAQASATAHAGRFTEGALARGTLAVYARVLAGT